MTKRKMTLLGAALAGAMLAGAAGANDMNRGSAHSGRVMAPGSHESAAQAMDRSTNDPKFVRDATPTSPNESYPARVREPQDPVARSDNPNLPNPVTPSAANESAAQPQASQFEPTNQPGMPRAPVGATR